jgi:ribonuclease HI
MNAKSITLYFDGCSKGNPGPSGSGAMIKYQSNITNITNMTNITNVINDVSLCEYVGNTTNNVAEYKGLILGLKYLNKHLNNIKHLTIKGDSMLVINHMTGKYKVKSPNLLPLYNEAKELIQSISNYNIDVNIEIIFLYIPREENKEADHLANMGLKLKPLVN